MIQKGRAVPIAGKSIAAAHEKRESTFMHKSIFTDYLSCIGIKYDMMRFEEMTISSIPFLTSSKDMDFTQLEVYTISRGTFNNIMQDNT